MDVEKSSLCNCVVNFLLQEKYHLTAFELLHELLEDGRHDQAIRLREFFSDPNLFPSDQIAQFNSLRAADPQSLLEEKETVEEKLAISEYELRLAQEDLLRLKAELQKQKESLSDGVNGSYLDVDAAADPISQRDSRDSSLSSLGPLKDAERKDINCAVKEYLLFAGYRLTAMTFIEEVTGQNLDVWPISSASVTDALRRYYYQYLSATTEAAEEKMSILRENESLAKENERLQYEKNTLLRKKELVDGQIVALTKSLEASQRDLKDKDILIQGLKQSLDLQRKELNDCRAEITSLKMHIEGARASRKGAAGEREHVQSLKIDKCVDEINSSRSETQNAQKLESTISLSEDTLPVEKVVEMNEEKVPPHSIESLSDSSVDNSENRPSEQDEANHNNITSDQSTNSWNGNANFDSNASTHDHLFKAPSEDITLLHKPGSPKRETISEKMALEAIQILSDALPKIVPYVLINHREELLPLIMCAIERHPDGNVRDSLTHTLFNLIKRPDEQQRRIIMAISYYILCKPSQV